MKLITTTPEKLSSHDVLAINKVVSRAFEHTENQEMMLQDTQKHLDEAETVQVVTEADRPVALAMYRSCLWRTGH